MLASLRDQKGQGGSGLYVRLRNDVALFWDFTALTWVASETSRTKLFLAEYPDADAFESRYQANFSLPSGSRDVVIEFVRSSDNTVRAEDLVSASTQSLSDKLTKALGLLYDNSVLSSASYDEAGKLLEARLRCYDTSAHAQMGGQTGVLVEYAVHSEYDSTGKLTLFRITE